MQLCPETGSSYLGILEAYSADGKGSAKKDPTQTSSYTYQGPKKGVHMGPNIDSGLLQP